jgi:hypothetical protein
MKKSSLTTAVLAGLAGLVGFVGSSNAVEVNPDGTGQVLLYPYYTVNAGQQTVVSVVNTTDAGKAIKVRFLEAYNSHEVLDFNLFMSPYDVWTGTVFALSDAGVSSDGGAFFTTDNSCTVPAIKGNTSLPALADGRHYAPFNNALFTDGGPTDVSRTREGYLEMIQMSDVTGATLAAITHVGGVPPGCGSASLRDTGNTDFVAPTGGLFGSGAIVNVGEGTLYPYSADAVDGFSGVSLFSDSGNTSPKLTDANDAGGTTATAYVFQPGGAIVTATYGGGSGRPVDAVSAVFEAKAMMNEWVANDVDQGTDWVVTFPTKRFYVDPTQGLTAALPPFVELFGETTAGQSCAQVGLGIWDREEGQRTVVVGDVFSPPPPGQPPSSLCHEVNVISISNDNTSVLGSNMALNIQPYGTSGWMSLDLDPAETTEPHAMSASAEGTVFDGLPATGFAAERFINDNAQPGKLSNYSGAWHHRIQREIGSSAAP